MVLGQIEKKLGLPPLKDVAETLHKLPDTRQLRLIKDVLEVAERVSKTGPELELVITVIREINSMPTEKLENLAKLLKQIERIIKKAPDELLQFITSLKE